jgi:hypothetical protein
MATQRTIPLFAQLIEFPPLMNECKPLMETSGFHVSPQTPSPPNFRQGQQH